MRPTLSTASPRAADAVLTLLCSGRHRAARRVRAAEIQLFPGPRAHTRRVIHLLRDQPESDRLRAHLRVYRVQEPEYRAPGRARRRARLRDSRSDYRRVRRAVRAHRRRVPRRVRNQQPARGLLPLGVRDDDGARFSLFVFVFGYAVTDEWDRRTFSASPHR